MPARFFDTCALAHRYLKCEHTTGVNRVVDRVPTIYIAEITMVEMISTLAGACRAGKATKAKFYRMQSVFMEDVASGKISIRPFTREDMVRAIHLLTHAGVIEKHGLKTADALIASSCRQMALETRSRPIFYTSDWPLYRTLYELDVFRSRMKLKFFGTTKDGIPAFTR